MPGTRSRTTDGATKAGITQRSDLPHSRGDRRQSTFGGRRRRRETKVTARMQYLAAPHSIMDEGSRTMRGKASDQRYGKPRAHGESPSMCTCSHIRTIHARSQCAGWSGSLHHTGREPQRAGRGEWAIVIISAAANTHRACIAHMRGAPGPRAAARRTSGGRETARMAWRRTQAALPSRIRAAGSVALPVYACGF